MGLIKNISQTVKEYFVDQYIQQNNLSVDLTDAAKWHSVFPAVQGTKEDYSSFAYASINCRAEKVREATDGLYKQQVKDLKEITSHPFIELIQQKNIYNQTFGTIKYLSSVSLDLFGNAYIYYPRKKFRMPAQLILLPSNRIMVNYTSDWTQIRDYTFTSSKGKVTYSNDEIIHIKLPDPFNLFLGKSTVSALRFQLDTDYLQSMYNKNFYLNDASVGGILQAPGKVTAENHNRLKEQLHTGHSGYENAGKWLITQEGMQASRMNATPREAQFKDSRLNVRDEIFGVFKTSKSILGYTDDVNRANAESARVSFIQNCIKPFAENISDAFDSFVKNNYDDRLLFKFDYDISQDSAELRADLEFMTKYGALTLNEVREAKGWSPRPELDTYYQQPKILKPNQQPPQDEQQ